MFTPLPVPEGGDPQHKHGKRDGTQPLRWGRSRDLGQRTVCAPPAPALGMSSTCTQGRALRTGHWPRQVPQPKDSTHGIKRQLLMHKLCKGGKRNPKLQATRLHLDWSWPHQPEHQQLLELWGARQPGGLTTPGSPCSYRRWSRSALGHADDYCKLWRPRRARLQTRLWRGRGAGAAAPGLAACRWVPGRARPRSVLLARTSSRFPWSLDCPGSGNTLCACVW